MILINFVLSSLLIELGEEGRQSTIHNLSVAGFAGANAFDHTHYHAFRYVSMKNATSFSFPPIISMVKCVM